MWRHAKTLYKLALRNMFFLAEWGGEGMLWTKFHHGGVFTSLRSGKVSGTQRGYCHWPLFLTGRGRTKFYQGGVPTSIWSGKVFCRQKGYCHWPVSSFLTSLFFPLLLLLLLFLGGGGSGRGGRGRGALNSTMVEFIPRLYRGRYPADRKDTAIGQSRHFWQVGPDQ